MILGWYGVIRVRRFHQMTKKKRPRTHIIADLSVNHVERYIFLCGYSVERVEYDYGYDLIIFTYNNQGEIENGQIYVQLKATDSLRIVEDNKIAFSLSRSDLELWLLEPMPCILIIYDAQTDQAYWLYLQAYFQKLVDFNLDKIASSITIYIPIENLLNQFSIKQFAKYRNNILKQLKGVIKHDD